MNKQWIVVRSKPRSEKVVYKELVSKNIEAYLPLLKERRKWSDRKKWVEFPLFSSYLFARIDIKNSILYLSYNGILLDKLNIFLTALETLSGFNTVITGTFDGHCKVELIFVNISILSLNGGHAITGNLVLHDTTPLNSVQRKQQLKLFYKALPSKLFF